MAFTLLSLWASQMKGETVNVDNTIYRHFSFTFLKILICLVLLIALCSVYLWDPRRKQEKSNSMKIR